MESSESSCASQGRYSLLESLTFPLDLKDRKWQPGRLTEAWVMMWREAKAWALIIQVKEQQQIRTFDC